jgi:hypothetical protein
VAEVGSSVQTIGGGVPGHGLVVEGVKGVKYAPKLLEMYENGKKIRQFHALIDLKSPKVLNKVYSQDFLEDYMNFKNFYYLRRC